MLGDCAIVPRGPTVSLLQTHPVVGANAFTYETSRAKGDFFCGSQCGVA